eukprot:TRINITY_DN7618_c0_g1_i3.p1 TRINITY_DN7618_c0_g1~~TRINITY_DN7618_c0_g1_i3.p1  ORF type:complete len:755 (+),score=106.08 TRINITY_DN7618_c0_g1_i3:469-2733(+)
MFVNQRKSGNSIHVASSQYSRNFKMQLFFTFLTLTEVQIQELPQSITQLRRLEQLVVEWKGNIALQSAPIGVSFLPCWNNTDKPWKEMTLSTSEALKSLKMYKFHGEGLSDISELVGRWRCCSSLNISVNNISALPTSFSSLVHLEELNISNNKFAEFPQVLVEMTWLTQLNISGNDITELPLALSRLVKLESLLIADESKHISVRRAPSEITSLPCWRKNPTLKKLTLYHQSVITPAVLTPIPVPPPPSFDWPDALQQYILPAAPILNEDDVLGQGGQGIVYKGTYLGSPVAVKVISDDADSIRYAADEVILTKMIHHHGIISIIGVYLDAKAMFIVMELANESLDKLLQRNGPLTSSEIVTFGKQIADALNYCVTQNPHQPVHHRDLKLENILIVNKQVKIADFGLAYSRKRSGFSTRLSGTKSGVAGHGTIHWQAPEIHSVVCRSYTIDGDHEGENVGHRGELSDVYGFGLVLWSMATGRYPFADMPVAQIPPFIFRGERPDIPGSVHPTVAHLVRACWRQNYKLRPRFSSIAAVLTICSSGNLDAVSKETLGHLVPISYSEICDMFTGELFQYLTDKGVSRGIALKLQGAQVSGKLFLKMNVDEFIHDYGISEAEAKMMDSLKYTNSRPIDDPISMHKNTSIPTEPIGTLKHLLVGESKNQVKSAPSRQVQNRPLPPKPIVEMNTDELVAYLRGAKGILESFLSVLQQEEVSGEGFLTILDEESLIAPPFNLKGLQLRSALKAIEEYRIM